MNPIAWLEADMARHMLVEFPLVAALGAWLAGQAARRVDGPFARVDALFVRIDAYGLTGWLFAGLVAAFWMIPAALDAAIASPWANAAKFASLLSAGFALRLSMRRSPRVLEAFFVMNFTWMTATVGLVYQEAEARLCLAYLADAQRRAGFGLVAIAVGALLAWIALRATRGYIFSSDSAGTQSSASAEPESSAIRAR